MAYLVLARKWRPQAFADLVGQDHIAQTLVNALTAGRIHHAFLFAGPRGVGKTSAARILAKALNCEQGMGPHPCGVCTNCDQITQGQSPDVFEIDGASNTGVDDVRGLRDNLRYLPALGRFKIYIIDEVHMLSGSAFNALLKTLEEPPEHVKFIFATTEAHKIPVTILSRCQRYDFRKIGLSAMLAWLKHVVAAESLDISERALNLVAQQGEGSMRDALSTLDQVLAFCGDKVLDDAVQGLLGRVEQRLLLNTLESLLQHDSQGLMNAIVQVDEQGYGLRQFCRELIEQARALLLCCSLPQPEGVLPELTAEDLKQLQHLVQDSTLEDIQHLLNMLLRCERELAQSVFPRITLETYLLRVATLPPAAEVSDLLRRLDGLESRWQAGAATDGPQASGGSKGRAPRRQASSAAGHTRPAKQVTASPAQEPPEAAAPFAAETSSVEAPAAASAAAIEEPAAEKAAPAIQDPVQEWGRFVRALQRQYPDLAGMLTQVHVISLEPPQLSLGVPQGQQFLVQTLQGADSKQRLQKAASAFWEQVIEVELRVVSSQDEVLPNLEESRQQARQTQQQQRQQQQQQLYEQAQSDLAVQQTLRRFNGRIREVRPRHVESRGEDAEETPQA